MIDWTQLKTAEQLEAESLDQAAQSVRAERDRLLASTDWTQVQDAPTDRDAWARYRQALRDVPQQQGFPSDVTWPNPPA